jgi:hypothetical protein
MWYVVKKTGCDLSGTRPLAKRRRLTKGKLFVEKIHLLNTIMPPLSVIYRVSGVREMRDVVDLPI